MPAGTRALAGEGLPCPGVTSFPHIRGPVATEGWSVTQQGGRILMQNPDAILHHWPAEPRALHKVLLKSVTGRVKGTLPKSPEQKVTSKNQLTQASSLSYSSEALSQKIWCLLRTCSRMHFHSLQASKHPETKLKAKPKRNYPIILRSSTLHGKSSKWLSSRMTQSCFQNSNALSILIPAEARSKCKSFSAQKRATHSARLSKSLKRRWTKGQKGPSVTASAPTPPREKVRAGCWC